MAKRTKKHGISDERRDLLLKEAGEIINGLWEEGRKDVKNGDAVVRFEQRTYTGIRRTLKYLTLYIFGILEAHAQKREALEERVAALEASPVDYRGVYEEGASYPARSLVSHNGCMWFSAEATKARPGEGRDWVLVVKRGRDGKDAGVERRPRSGTRV